MGRDKEVPYMEDHQEIVRETRKYDATGTLGTAGKWVQNQFGIDKEYMYIGTIYIYRNNLDISKNPLKHHAKLTTIREPW